MSLACFSKNTLERKELANANDFPLCCQYSGCCYSYYEASSTSKEVPAEVPIHLELQVVP